MSEQPIIRRRTQKLNTISEERVNNQKTQSQYQPYKDAAGASSTIGIPPFSAMSLRKTRSRACRFAACPSYCVGWMARYTR